MNQFISFDNILRYGIVNFINFIILFLNIYSDIRQEYLSDFHVTVTRTSQISFKLSKRYIAQ